MRIKKTNDSKMTKFIETIAKQLQDQCSQSELQSLLSNNSSLQNVLTNSIQSLPASSLKKSLQNSDKLQEELKKNLKTLKLQSKEDINKSVNALVEKYQKLLKSNENFEEINGEFCEIFNVSNEPRLDFIWSFCGVSYNFKQSDDALKGAEKLQDFIVNCIVTSNWNPSQKICAMLPVISMICKCLKRLFPNKGARLSDSDCKIVDSLRQMTTKLLGFISICRENEKSLIPSSVCDELLIPNSSKSHLGDELLLPNSSKAHFDDSLVPNWPKCLSCCDGFLCCGETDYEEKSMDDYFPLVPPRIQSRMLSGCSFGMLATVVCFQASLLMPILHVVYHDQVSNTGKKGPQFVVGDMNFCRDLKLAATSGILRSYDYASYDILLQVLLDAEIPIPYYVDDVEGFLLKGIFYEAATLADCGSLIRCKGISANLDPSIVSRIFIKKLLVARLTIQFYRSVGERTKAILFERSFMKIRPPSELKKWLQLQLSASETLKQKNQDLIGWLVNMDDKDRLMKILQKHSAIKSDATVNNESMSSDEMDTYSPGRDEDFFVIDKQGVGISKEPQTVEKAFIEAAHEMITAETDTKHQSAIDLSDNQNLQLNSDSDLSESEVNDSDASIDKKRPSDIDSDFNEDSDTSAAHARISKKMRVQN